MSSEPSEREKESGQDGYSSRVLKGAALLTASKGGSYVLAFLSTLVLARLLTPDDFGVMALAMAVVSVTAALFDLPVTQALIAIEDPSDADFDSAWTISIIRALVVTVFVWILAYPVAEIFNSPQIANVIVVLAFQQIIFGLRNPYFERFARKLDYTKDAWAEIIAKVVQVIVCISIAVIWKSYWAFVIAGLISSFAGLVVTFIVSRERPSFSLKSVRQLFDFSFWLALGAVTNKLNDQINRFVATKAFGQGALGQISMGEKLSSEISQFLLVPIVRSLYSAFSRFSSDKHRLRHAYLKAQAITFAIVMPIGVGLGLVAEYLVPVLLGEKWGLSVSVVQFVAPTIGLMVITSPVRAVGMALNKTQILFYRDFASLIIEIVGMIVGTYYFGFIGFLSAYCITTFLVVMINLNVLGSFVGLSVAAQLLNVRRSLLAGLSMVVVVITLKFLLEAPQSAMQNIFVTLLLAIAGATSYFAVHYITWLLQKRPDGVEKFAIQTLSQLVAGRTVA